MSINYKIIITLYFIKKEKRKKKTKDNLEEFSIVHLQIFQKKPDVHHQ